MPHHHKRIASRRTSGDRRRRLRIGLLCIALSAPAAGLADESGEDTAGHKPLWEIGAGVGAVAFPHYRGSDDYTVLAAPLPLIIYRGDILKLSRDGARAQVVDTPRFEINFSGGGSIPVDSDSDELRRGMPDLDPVVSFGPRLSWLFSEPARRDRYSLRLDLPVYGAVATDLSHFDGVGWLVEPRLRWRRRWSVPGRDADWSYAVSGSLLWASDAYHDYYYSVAPRFATPERPAFDADGGYSGMSATAGVYHHRGRLRLGAVLTVNYLKGAAFEDSPLVATTDSYIAGLYVAWSLWESEARAPEHDDD